MSLCRRNHENEKPLTHLVGPICATVQLGGRGETNLYLQLRSRRSISLDNLAIFVNKKLGEVPFNTIAKEATFLRFQVLVQWCSVLTIHINLRNQVNKLLSAHLYLIGMYLR